MIYSIKSLELLSLEGGDTGGSQEWYGDLWQRKAGCGPVCAANIIWYITRAHESRGALCDAQAPSRQSFLELMERMFEFVKPGAGGVNSSKIFITGAQCYAQSRGQALDAHALEIAPKPARRPDAQAVSQFLCGALERNVPVAFLNLSNGDVNELESWHWVTILALETNTLAVTIADQGKVFDIDLGLWLKTSALGGAFVELS